MVLETNMHPVQLTKELVRINSCNPPGGESEVLDFLAPLLESAGFHVSYDWFGKGRGSLVAKFAKGNTESALCFVGHIDTVPFGTAEWTYPPLEVHEVDGRIYGRGACDMKSGIASMCCAAMEAIKDEKCGDITLFICGGEETGCEGSFHVVKDADLMGRPGAVVVCEPTNARPLLGHKGAFWLEGKTVGKTAHGSMPELGVNALYKAVDAIQKLRELDHDTHPHEFLGSSTLSINTLKAGQIINAVPDQAEFRMDMRTTPGQTGEALLDQIQQLAGDDVSFTTLMDMPAVWTERDDPWVDRSFALLAQFMDAPPAIETVPFFTDASAFRTTLPEVPIIILGPGDPGLAHKPDEYVKVTQIERARDMYLALCSDWR